MPPDAAEQDFEPPRIATARLLLMGAIGAVVVLTSLGLLLGAYHLLLNRPLEALKPVPTPGPQLETTLFRTESIYPKSRPNPAVGSAQGYRWLDSAQTRLQIPIERAMAITAARGPQAFDTPATAPEHAR